ncbi:MAG: dockerin type I domain-containing protein [Oscillospiraceae bacterium]|nr:dockerin type I domain-containing protein [Oscillospiraceae bacterium]
MKKLLKKLISVSLAAMMSVMAVPITQDTIAFAISNTLRTKLNVENVTIGPNDAGSEIQIPIKIENLSAAGDNPNLKNCTLELQYDDELSFHNKEKGMMRFTDFYNDKSSHILEIEASADTAINEDGVLFTLSFMLPESLENSSGYDITINNCELTNEDGDEISSSNSDGYIEYKESKETKETFYQENPIEIAVESAEIPAMAGEEISVPVTISNNVGIAGSMFSFEYDSRLKYLDTSWDIIKGTDVVNETTSADGMNILTITSANASNTTKEGMLFSLNFEISEDAKEGDIYCINIVNCSLYDTDSHDLKFVTKNAKLTARDNNILPDPTEDVVETTEPETTNNIVTKPVSKKDDPDSLSVGTVVKYDDTDEKKVDVPVYIENNSGFASNKVVFRYDTRLSINETGVNLSSSIQGNLIPFIDTNEGTITVMTAIDSNVKIDGNVYWLSFTLPDNAKEGDFYSINIDSVPGWNHINEKGEDGYVRGSVTYRNLTVKTYDGGISIEKKPVETTTNVTETKPSTNVTTAKKADEDERRTVPIQPLTVNSKNIISVSTVHMAPEDAGKKISVPVYISENEGFAAVGFLIIYDKRLTTESDDIVISDYVKGTPQTLAFDNIKSVSIAVAGTQNTNASAKICDISFTVPANAEPGDKYDIEIKKVYCWDHLIESNEADYESGFTKMRELSISVKNGGITVTGSKSDAATKNDEENKNYNKDHDDTSNVSTPSTDDITIKWLLGDANLDNIIDTKDAIIVLQYYAESIAGNNHTKKLEKNADVNFDGKYDAKDATFILQFYAERLSGLIKGEDKDDLMVSFMKDKGYEKK